MSKFTPESNIIRQVMLAAPRVGARLFRNTVAQMFTGRAQRITEPTTVHLEPGDVVIRKARTVHAGLCVGSSDLIGWTPRVVTTGMVGRTLALFSALEIKAGHTATTPEQKNFCEAVRVSGGLAGIVRSEAEAIRVLSGTDQL